MSTQQNASTQRHDIVNFPESIPAADCITTTQHTIPEVQHIKDLIVHSEEEPKWLYIQRKSQISCKFRERAEFAVNSEKEPKYLSILR